MNRAQQVSEQIHMLLLTVDRCNSRGLFLNGHPAHRVARWAQLSGDPRDRPFA